MKTTPAVMSQLESSLSVLIFEQSWDYLLSTLYWAAKLCKSWDCHKIFRGYCHKIWIEPVLVASEHCPVISACAPGVPGPSPHNDRSPENKQTKLRSGELCAVPGDLSGFVPGPLMQSASVWVGSHSPGDNSRGWHSCDTWPDEGPSCQKINRSW